MNQGNWAMVYELGYVIRKQIWNRAWIYRFLSALQQNRVPSVIFLFVLW